MQRQKSAFCPSNPQEFWSSLPQCLLPHFSTHNPKFKSSFSLDSLPNYPDPITPTPDPDENDDLPPLSSSHSFADPPVSTPKQDFQQPPDTSSTQDTLSDEGKPMDLELENSDEEAYSKPKLRAVSHGLPNLGNTCYMNCMLQCLLNTKPLSEYFVTRQHHNLAKPETLPLAEAFRHTIFSAFVKMMSPDKMIRDHVTGLKKAIEKVAPIFQGFDQNDAHEFFRLFTQKLHDELNDAPLKGQPYKEFKASKEGLALPELAAEWTNYSQEREHSVLNEVFGGQILNEIECDACGHVSHSFEDTQDFSLNLASEHDVSSSIPDNIANLYSCFKDFTKTEALEGYRCAQCKKTGTSAKRTMIWRQPELLVTQLKRFVYDIYGNRQTVKERISFPLEGLTLGEFTHEKSKEEQGEYRLYGIVNHFGGLEFGHYIAYIYNEQQKGWFEYNDNEVSRLETHDIESFAKGSPYPYVLFYKKI